MKRLLLIPLLVVASLLALARPAELRKATPAWFNFQASSVNVYLSESQTVLFPGPTTQSVVVVVNGLGTNPPGLTVHWDKRSGPGSVTFSDPTAFTNTALYSLPGSYQLVTSAYLGNRSNYAIMAAFVVSNTIAPPPPPPPPVNTNNLPPVISILSPTNGSLFIGPVPVQFLATASDKDGQVTQVAFATNGVNFATSTVAPYSITFAPGPGSYLATATVRDNAGSNVAVSVSFTVKANVPPTVTITSPANGASFLAPATIPISATAADTDGTITKVDFRQALVLLGVDTTAPYSFTWGSVPAGTYVLSAIATDNLGAAGISANITIQVTNPPPNIPPIVSVTFPANGAIFTSPVTVNATATASDPDGAVANVVFSDNGFVIGTDLSAPYFFSYSPTVGAHLLVATATDNLGATASSSISFTVNASANQPPEVTIVFPTNGVVYTAPANIMMNAVASDPDGTVTNVQFFHGTTLIASDATSPYLVTWSNVPVGTYSLTAVAYDNQGASTISAAVPIQVNPDLPPSVSITSPTNGVTYTSPITITLAANATDVDGAVSKVVFTDNGVVISADTTAPFSFTYAPGIGSHVIVATATDNAGLTGTASLSFTVQGPINQLPVVSITSPLSGATFTAPASITINAAASDPDGTVTKVDFFNGSTLVGTDTAAPYSFVWTPVSAGSYSITARATDNSGGTSSSAAISVTVNNNLPPVVAIIAPTNGAVFTSGTLLTPSATASDPDGTVAQVSFSDNGTPLATDLTAPYSFSYSPAIGTHLLTATATDNLGLSTSASVSFTVQPPPNVPPTVSVTSPTTGQMFIAPASISIAVNAADSDGTVTKVEFLAGTTVLATDTTAPYSVLWSAVTPGTYSITARATDNSGAVTVSTAVTIQVKANVPPVVSITSPVNGTIFTAPVTITVAATASDTDGSIANVAFLDNGTLIFTDTTSPYGFSFSPIVATQILTAIATDNLGGTGTNSVNFTVQPAPNVPPTVVITGPTNGASFTAPANIAITATASDSDGTVTKVDFKANAALIGTDVTSPYSFGWNSVTAGTYALTAIATDNSGATATSSAVTVTVNPPMIPLFVNSGADLTITLPSIAQLTNSIVQGTGIISTNWSKVSGPGVVTFGNAAAANTTASFSIEGSYVLQLTVATATSSLSDPVTVTVLPIPVNQIPTVSITSPANNAVFVLPVTVVIAATALDTDGTVAKVDFFSGSSLLGTDSIAPYTFSWTPSVSGTYFLSAKATDNVGGLGISSSVTVTVNTNKPPTVSFTSPTNGAVFVTPVSLVAAVTATDADGTVTQVSFADNGAIIGTDLSAPYSASYSPSVGSHVLVATATDNSGLTSTATVSFTVQNSPDVPPVVTLTAPVNGATYTAPATVTLAATASDPDGTVTKVDFYLGSTLIATDASAPYSFVTNGVTAGSYSFSAKATDNGGLTAASAAVSVTVNNNLPPVISITSPANGSTFVFPITLTLSATASDPDGTIASVAFKDNGSTLVTDATSPYSFNYAPAVGVHTISAVATDNLGLTATASLSLTISDPGFPTNTLPFEIAGAKGATVTASFGLNDVIGTDVYSFFLEYQHSLHSTNGFKVQYNNDLPINVNDLTFLTHPREKAFGGHFSACSVIRSTNYNILGTSLLNGINTVRFIFTDTNRSPAAVRVLRCNFVHAGTNLILSQFFMQEDPGTWAPIDGSAAHVTNGKAQFQTASLVGVAPDGTMGTIQARCADCHAQDGRDLKYFNYSNHSIIERCKFHGLIQANAEDVASYIRSLTSASPGRPWNPPYQPGPGLDSAPLSNWSAGAGIYSVVDDDQITLSQVFGGSFTNTSITKTNDLSVRQTQIILQLPIWNQWLPGVHPLDAYGAAAFVNAGSKMLTDYDGNPAHGAPVGTSFLRNTLVSGSVSALRNSDFIMGDWVLDRTGGPFNTAISPKSSRTDAVSSFKAYSAGQWQAVKLWELVQEFGLEEIAQQAFFLPLGEARTWPKIYRCMFDLSPNIEQLPLTNNGIQDGSTKAFKHLSTSWYTLQLILENGNRTPDMMYQTSQLPLDWAYTDAVLSDLQQLIGIPLAGLFMEYKVKEIQCYSTQYGPSRWNTGGFDPFIGTTPDAIINRSYNGQWGDTPLATRKLVLEAWLSNWIFEWTRYPVSDNYVGDVNANDSSHPGLTTPTYTPTARRDTTVFGDSLTASFVPDSNGCCFWNNMYLSGVGIDPALQNKVLDMCALVWPLGWKASAAAPPQNWNALRPNPGAFQWIADIGSPSSSYDIANAQASAIDSSGNVIVVGTFQGTVNINGTQLTSAGSADLFLAKYSPSGSLLWSKSLGGLTSSKAFNGHVAVDHSGNIVLIGNCGGTLDFGGGNTTTIASQDTFIAKYSPSGIFAWSKRFGPTTFSEFAMGLSVAIDASDNVIFESYSSATINLGGGSLAAGPFLSKYSASGAYLWSMTLSGAGGMALDGTASNVLIVRGDLIKKYAGSDGHLLWSKQSVVTGSASVVGTTVDVSGNILATGYFTGTVDFGGGPLTSANPAYQAIFMAKYSPAGDYQWAKKFGGQPTGDSGYAIASDSNGNIFLTGYVAGPVDFGGGYKFGSTQDIFIAKYSSSGAYQWAKRIGASYQDAGNSVVADANGNAIVCGYFGGSVDFGGPTALTGGPSHQDAFVVKFGP